MEQGFYAKLEEIAKNGKPTQKEIAKYIYEYKDETSKLKINDVAEKTNTSSASVVRFAKELGLSGFAELKVALKINNNILQGQDNLAADNFEFCETIIDSLQKTHKCINQRSIETLVTKIDTCRKVDVFAIGETNVVAMDFQLKLLRIGKIATAFQDTHSQYFAAKNAKKGDIAIGISYSATTITTLDALRHAKESGSYTVLICKNGVTCPDYVDLIIYVEASESSSRVFSTTSRFTLLYMTDYIYHLLISKNKEFYYHQLDVTRIKRR
jgi:DNA-binding MurR/RpiR family transcriptional regulator